MQKKIFRLGIAVLALLITTAVVAGVSSAQEGKLWPVRFNKENHQEVVRAIENNDYANWQELVGDRKIGEVITEENFSQLQEVHQLMREGNYEEAKVLKEDLGLPMGKLHMHKRVQRDPEKMEAIKEAIKNGDYQAWLEATNGYGPAAKVITEENFDRFVEAKKLFQAGNYEEGAAIMKELGLNKGMPRCHKFAPVTE